MLEVTSVHKAFGKDKVLKGIDLTVNDGDVVTIIGSSGSGKTTLLRCMNFLEKADSGKLTVGGMSEDFHSVTHKQILEIRKRTAMVFQNFSLFANKTVLQNVTEGLVVARNVPKDEANKHAKEILEKVGLTAKLDEYPSRLSGGQQRVGIARALAVNPHVILLDEPTSALDPELVGETLNLLRSLVRLGLTMIIVTHEIGFAYDIANKVVFLDNGVVAEQGTPQEVLLSPKNELTKRFLSRFNYGWLKNDVGAGIGAGI